MDNIKIVRFKDAIDVICTCVFDKKDYAYDLYEPMMFDITQRGQLVLQHWLPLGVMKQRHVRIKEEDILCTFDPNEEFTEYYSNMVLKMNSVMDSNLEDKNSETEQVIQAMEELESKSIPIH